MLAGPRGQPSSCRKAASSPMQNDCSGRPGASPGGIVSNAARREILALGRFLVPAVVLLVAAGCGGGGGSGPSGPTPTPTPRQTPIPVFTPVRASPTPSPTPTARPGSAQVILSEGDTLAGNLRVNDIREAALAPDRQIAVIIRAAGSEARQVIRRKQDASFEILFDASKAPAGLDLTTLGDLQNSDDGSVLFTGGDGIDSDQLYLAAAGSTAVALAGASPGIEKPEFRVLGAKDLGPDGVAAFVGGGDPCMTDEEGSTRCDVHLYVTEDATPTEIVVEGNDLKDANPRAPRAIVADDGAVYFSVRGSGQEPVLLKVSGGGVETLLSVDSEVPGVEGLINPTLEAVGSNGRFVVTASLRSEDAPRPLVLGILTIAGGTNSFTEISRIGMARGSDSVVRLQTVGIDDQGAVLFLETLEETGSQAENPPQHLALRLFDAGNTVDVAVEGEKLPGSDESVIDLRDPHFNRRGEVALVAELGQIEQTPSGPTTTVRGTDVL